MQEGQETERVSELDRLMREADESGRRLKTMQTCATLALVAVFVVSLLAIYSKGRSMYTADKIQASLAPQMQAIQPQLTETLRSVVTTAGPHYARLGQERLEALLPKVGAELETELTGLAQGLAERAERRVAKALAEVEGAQLARLGDIYPELDEKSFADLSGKWARDVQADTELVLADFEERVLSDFQNLSTTIESFGPNQYDDFEKNELVRYYAHLWLTLIDTEVMSAGDESEVQGG